MRWAVGVDMAAGLEQDGNSPDFITRPARLRRIRHMFRRWLRGATLRWK